jgi:putative two-component system response regulator
MEVKWRLGAPLETLAPPLVVTASVDGSWSDHSLDSPRRSAILMIEAVDTGGKAIRSLLEDDGYHVVGASGTSEMLEILNKAPVDLVLLDMFLSEGMEFCQRLRADPRMDLVPVLMLSPFATVEDEVAGIGSGADEFLARPYHPDVLRARVRRMLRHKAIVDRLEESEAILLALAQTVEQRDNHTGGHCQRLAALSVAMGMAMELPPHHLLALHRGGYLHDVGKIAIPDSVLLKRGPLTAAEWAIMRTHTAKGEEICRGIKCLSPVLPIIRSHHERWDGSGYPDRLAGHNIPLLARVLQFADIYDALMAERSYKPSMSSARALQVMQEETDGGWHDPELMRLFLRLRHDIVREAAATNAQHWQDVHAMRESLENLGSAILRS